MSGDNSTRVECICVWSIGPERRRVDQSIAPPCLHVNNDEFAPSACRPVCQSLFLTATVAQSSRHSVNRSFEEYFTWLLRFSPPVSSVSPSATATLVFDAHSDMDVGVQFRGAT
ncbi:unnamed protein product [Protopolystoma xenopodis]|uniref:Uncharacterized protein n=1 Tax=Protopolystoma xenopodis TaxID=117903 RepID=A0A448XSS6_9PLAT|nr:unnamed protein product [Protopolystoma xenopodis]